MDLQTAEKLRQYQELIDEFVDLTRRKRYLLDQVDEIKARLVKIGGGREGGEFCEGELLKAIQALGLKNIKSDNMTIYINRSFGVSCQRGHARAVDSLKRAGRLDEVEERANLKLMKQIILERIDEALAAGEPIAAEEALPEELREEFAVYEEFTLRGKDSRPKKGE
jgi:uncharacterized protein YaaR (DUF327 family)